MLGLKNGKSQSSAPVPSGMASMVSSMLGIEPAAINEMISGFALLLKSCDERLTQIQADVAEMKKMMLEPAPEKSESENE